VNDYECLGVQAVSMRVQTWIQDLLFQDQDFDVQDQDSILTRPILEVYDWNRLLQTKRLKKSWQAENPAYR